MIAFASSIFDNLMVSKTLGIAIAVKADKPAITTTNSTSVKPFVTLYLLFFWIDIFTINIQMIQHHYI